jgi:hypothetical protein
MSVTKSKCPITMYFFFKSEFFGNFGPLIEHGAHWIDFTIFTFLSEYIYIYSKCLYKIWNKIISFDMKKKEKT